MVFLPHDRRFCGRNRESSRCCRHTIITFAVLVHFGASCSFFMCSGRFGAFWCILVHFEVFRCILVHSGAFWSILLHSGEFLSTLVHRVHLGDFGAFWRAPEAVKFSRAPEAVSEKIFFFWGIALQGRRVGPSSYECIDTLLSS